MEIPTINANKRKYIVNVDYVTFTEYMNDIAQQWVFDKSGLKMIEINNGMLRAKYYAKIDNPIQLIQLLLTYKFSMKMSKHYQDCKEYQSIELSKHNHEIGEVLRLNNHKTAYDYLVRHNDISHVI